MSNITKCETKCHYHVVRATLLGDQNFFRTIDNKISSLVIYALAHCGKLLVIRRQVGTRLFLGQVANLRKGRLEKSTKIEKKLSSKTLLLSIVGIRQRVSRSCDWLQLSGQYSLSPSFCLLRSRLVKETCTVLKWETQQRAKMRDKPLQRPHMYDHGADIPWECFERVGEA